MGISLLNEKISVLMIMGGSIIFISTLMVTVYGNRLVELSGNFFMRKSKIKISIS
jgi:hypothetical protein